MADSSLPAAFDAAFADVDPSANLNDLIRQSNAGADRLRELAAEYGRAWASIGEKHLELDLFAVSDLPDLQAVGDRLVAFCAAFEKSGRHVAYGELDAAQTAMNYGRHASHNPAVAKAAASLAHKLIEVARAGDTGVGAHLAGHWAGGSSQLRERIWAAVRYVSFIIRQLAGETGFLQRPRTRQEVLKLVRDIRSEFERANSWTATDLSRVRFWLDRLDHYLGREHVELPRPVIQLDWADTPADAIAKLDRIREALRPAAGPPDPSPGNKIYPVWEMAFSVYTDALRRSMETDRELTLGDSPERVWLWLESHDEKPDGRKATWCTYVRRCLKVYGDPTEPARTTADSSQE